tara:strand:+ start:33 stop:428 length:396 start_codon:yes stop_codon:yes gene_type:complete
VVIFKNSIEKYTVRCIYLFAALVLSGCLQFSDPDDPGRAPQKNLPQTEKESPMDKPLVKGTLKLESRKQIDLSQHLDEDFDRIIISNGKGRLSNLSKATVLKSKKIWFTKSGITQIKLIKNGRTIYRGRLK